MIFSRLVISNMLAGVLVTTLVFLALIFSTGMFSLLTDDAPITNLILLGYFYYLPADLMNVFAPAMIIGTIIGLSRLVSTGELTAMRALGFGRASINAAVFAGALLCTMTFYAALQWVVEPAELTAREYWGQTEKTSTLVRGNRWLRIENSWLRLGKVHTESVFAEVEIITLTEDQSQVERFIRAKKANLDQDGVWTLFDVQRFTPETKIEYLARLEWVGDFERAALKKISVPEKRQRFTTLLSSLTAASTVGEDANRILTELVMRFAEPLAATMLIMWMVSVLLVSSRDGSDGRRRVIAVLAGLFFWILNQLIVQFADTLSLIPVMTGLSVIICANIIGLLASYGMTR